MSEAPKKKPVSPSYFDRRDVMEHILFVLQEAGPGVFKTVAEISKAKSPEYNGERRPSIGAITARLFNSKTPLHWLIVPVYGHRKPNGQYVGAGAQLKGRRRKAS